MDECEECEECEECKECDYSSKRQFLLDTIGLLRDNLSNKTQQKSLSNIADSVFHLAPEIIDSGWYKIFNFTSNSLTDQTNPEHKACFEIYHTRLKEYSVLVKTVVLD